MGTCCTTKRTDERQREGFREVRDSRRQQERAGKSFVRETRFQSRRFGEKYVTN